MNRRGWLVGVAIVFFVVVTAMLASSDRRGGAPLSPDSTARDGTRAFVELIEGIGGDIVVADEIVTSAGVVVVLSDTLADRQLRDLDDWVEDGGTLVLADPISRLGLPTAGRSADEVTGSCPDPRFDGVDALRLAPDDDDGRRRLATRVLVPEPGSVTCFADGDGAIVDIRRVGAGEIVTLGGPWMFTNELIGEADNALLAARLAIDGDATTVVLTAAGTAVGSGDDSLFDLVDPSVKAMFLQWGVALAVVGLWRGRRFGRPVLEPQPVVIEGSELTSAVGRLLERNRHPDRAAALLRDAARRDLGPRLGLRPDATVDEVAAVLGGVTTLSSSQIHTAIAAPVADDTVLLTVARLLTHIRKEVLHGPTTTTVR